MLRSGFGLLAASISRTEGYAAAERLVSALAAETTTVLARVWVAIAKTDELRLMASAGNPTGGGTYGRIDGSFHSLRAGTGKIGQVAASRAPLVASRVRGDETWLANPGWAARQGVRGFAALPLVSEGTLVGVLALFTRLPLAERDAISLELLAEIAASAMAGPGLRSAHGGTAEDPTSAGRGVNQAATRRAREGRRVLTRAELRAEERANIEAALRETGGRVFGPNGAAGLLGMKPTTLASRMQALGIARPSRRTGTVPVTP